MVGTINPVVYRVRPRRNWLVSTAVFSAASGVSAAVVGAALGLIGALLPSRTEFELMLIAVVAAAYACHEFGWIRLPAPQRRRQVPSGWRVGLNPFASAALYGAALGPGLATYVFSSAYYVLLLLVVTSRSTSLGALVMFVYGFSKGLPILVANWKVCDPAEAYRIGVGIARSERHAHAFCGAALLMVAGGLLYFL
jgi:cytochrome c biogenesis protein CcdA